MPNGPYSAPSGQPPQHNQFYHQNQQRQGHQHQQHQQYAAAPPIGQLQGQMQQVYRSPHITTGGGYASMPQPANAGNAVYGSNAPAPPMPPLGGGQMLSIASMRDSLAKTLGKK